MVLRQVGITGQVVQDALAARRGVLVFTKHPQKRGPRVGIHAGVNACCYCMPSLRFVKRPNAMRWVGGVKWPETARTGWHVQYLESAAGAGDKTCGCGMVSSYIWRTTRSGVTVSLNGG
jgi:hypothetical protein